MSKANISSIREKPIMKAFNSILICLLKNDNIHKTKAVSVAIGIAHPFKVG